MGKQYDPVHDHVLHAGGLDVASNHHVAVLTYHKVCKQVQ